MIKMLVLDIDGTVFRKDYTASEKVKMSLKQSMDKGVKVVLCTGRMYAATKQIAIELGLNTPVVAYQGGLIKNFLNDTNTLYEKNVPVDIARDVIKELKERNIFFNLYVNDLLMVEYDSKLIQEYASARNIGYKVIGNSDEIDLVGLNKILAIDENPEVIDKLQQTLAEKYKNKLYVIRSTPTFCEFSNIEATKGNAVRYLANLWNIEKDEIMACGDQDNDIEMLLAAGVKVAMGNASDGLKAIANYVTESVDNDGVALAIEKFIVKE